MHMLQRNKLGQRRIKAFKNKSEKTILQVGNNIFLFTTRVCYIGI